MKILVGWDDPQQAQLLELYLSAGDNEVKVCLEADELKSRVRAGGWEVLFLAMTFPCNADEGYAVFAELQEEPNPLPVVLGCRSTEMIGLVKFLTHGLRFYLIRDERGDFMFLALSCLDSAVAAVRAERSKQLAARLREEMDGVRRLQESIIPQGISMPQGYSIAARYEPAQVSVVGDHPVVMAGGDYYNVFRPDRAHPRRADRRRLGPRSQGVHVDHGHAHADPHVGRRPLPRHRRLRHRDQRASL